MAVIAGFEALIRPCTVEVISDSKYVTDAFNQHWIDHWRMNGWRTAAKKPVLNDDLWKRLLKAEPVRNKKQSAIKAASRLLWLVFPLI